MTVKHMKIFIQVYQTQNITRAAGLLHMTQPAVSRAIQELEKYAVNLNEGFTDFRLNEIPVMQALARNSKRVIAVLDSSKLNKLSKKKALELNEADVLVTDSRARGLELYAKAGLSVS